MHIRAVAILGDGTKVLGYLTTEHPASSHGQPVFTDRNNLAYDWAWIVDVSTAPQAGTVTSERKKISSAENGKRGGRPRKE